MCVNFEPRISNLKALKAIVLTWEFIVVIASALYLYSKLLNTQASEIVVFFYGFDVGMLTLSYLLYKRQYTEKLKE